MGNVNKCTVCSMLVYNDDIRKAMSCSATFILAALLMPCLRYQEKGGRAYKQIQMQTNTNETKRNIQTKLIQKRPYLNYHIISYER